MLVDPVKALFNNAHSSRVNCVACKNPFCNEFEMKPFHLPQLSLTEKTNTEEIYIRLHDTNTGLGKTCHGSCILAHQIEKSYILPHVRNSHLTPVAPCVQMFFFNTGCIGRHVISSLSAQVTMTSKRFKKSKWRTPRFYHFSR